MIQNSDRMNRVVVAPWKIEAQRKPEQQTFGVIESQGTQCGEYDGPDHRLHDTEAVGKLGGDQGRYHRGDPHHRRVQADQARGNAAFFQDDAEKRKAEADGDADGGNGRNGGDERRPMNFFDMAGLAVRRFKHELILRACGERIVRNAGDRKARHGQIQVTGRLSWDRSHPPE